MTDQTVAEAPEFGAREILAALRVRAGTLFVAPVLAGVVAVGVSFLIPPTFTATTTLLPPAQQSSSALSAIASQLGALGGLAGAAAGVKTPADQYVAFLRSRNVTDAIISKFDLKAVYDREFMFDVRLKLSERARFLPGKKDGLIVIEVDDHDPKRAAAMANAFVDELQRMTSEFAVGEAAQRRLFFEKQLVVTRKALTEAEAKLATSGVSSDTFKLAPQAAVTAVAKLKASVTAQEVRIAALQGYATEDNPELRQARLELAALRAQLERMEQSNTEPTGDAARYTERYREFKYHEALFELIAKQYELARLDEARDGATIQVIDVAEVPERKSRPKRATFGAAGALIVAGLIFLETLVRAWRAHEAKGNRSGT